MRLTRLFFISVLTGTFFIACNKDDDQIEEIPPRDRGEQAIADDEALMAYLQTHFYNEEEFQNPPVGFDYVVKFDTISGENANRTPILDSDLLITKTVNRDDIDYKVYVLKIREGAGRKATYADSVYVAYKGELLDKTVFDSNTVVPVWFDLPGYIGLDNQGRPTQFGGSIPGFMEGVTEFREASGFTVNPDNTINWNNDFGVGAIFFPSGLGYFNNARPAIPSYSPLVFSINLYRAVEADHDNDGIPSWMEDLDGDGNLYNDDTDKNGFPNHSDRDDDGDGTPTRDEIIINADGSIEFPDRNGNGIPNYLDPEEFENVNEEE
jgi:hypothetical protein